MDLPPFATHSTRTGRRLVAAVPEPDALDAVRWARSLQQSGLVEEYELGPITLEDSYVRLVGRDDTLELGGSHV